MLSSIVNSSVLTKYTSAAKLIDSANDFIQNRSFEYNVEHIIKEVRAGMLHDKDCKYFDKLLIEKCQSGISLSQANKKSYCQKKKQASLKVYYMKHKFLV